VLDRLPQRGVGDLLDVDLLGCIDEEQAHAAAARYFGPSLVAIRKLEKELNRIGIHQYDQIAGWTASHVAWIDQELKTRGRVQRDDWVAQAKALMSGTKR
jgi:hypothetical protein